MAGTKGFDYNVLIIGAGLSGISTLYNVRKHFPKWRALILEAAPEVGGHVDLLKTWEWSEEFAAQPEILRYITAFCEKNDLARDIRFNTRIKAAKWAEEACQWQLTDTTGQRYTGRFLVTGVGFLSAPQLPNYDGISSFTGISMHTSQWPRDFSIRDLARKRMGVIGTGATGVQVITTLSKEPSLASLTVFQRSPNWAAPLPNFTLSDEQKKHYRVHAEDIFDRCTASPNGFIHGPDPRTTLYVPEDERLAFWEDIWAKPGFAKAFANFRDVGTDPTANALYSAFIASKIRERVQNPVIAEKLIPRDHGYAMKRPPLESGYYEAYNDPRVKLVDLRDTPITCVTPAGIRTSDGTEYALDVLIYATGFDAITGALENIAWSCADGRPLFGSDEDKAVWPDLETRSWLGLMAPGVPNAFMVMGPHMPLGNIPRSIENAVKVVMEVLLAVDERGVQRVEATEEAARGWYDIVVRSGEGALASKVDGWLTGVNTNVEGRTKRRAARYYGSNQRWWEEVAKCRESGWEGLMMK